MLWISNLTQAEYLLSLVKWNSRKSAPVCQRKAKMFKGQVYELLECKFANPDYNVAQLSRDMGLSTSQLFRKCMLYLDQSPVNVIKTFRLKKSREFLNKGIYNVSEAAYLSGFNSLSYFSRCFNKEYGQLPSKVIV